MTTIEEMNGKLLKRHKLCLLYPSTTLPDFAKHFPKLAVTKLLKEQALLGRNNQDFPIDITLMDLRISRKQAQITFDKFTRHFKLTNLTNSQVSVDNVNLFQDDIATLRHDSVIRFEQLAEGKAEKLNFIQFRCAITIGSFDEREYVIHVMSEKAWESETGQKPTQNAWRKAVKGSLIAERGPLPPGAGEDKGQDKRGVDNLEPDFGAGNNSRSRRPTREHINVTDW